MAETLAGITVRAARALAMADRGLLKTSLRADLVIFPTNDYREILYQQGSLHPRIAVVQGIPHENYTRGKMRENSFTCYTLPSREIWQGRSDGPDALRFHEVVKFADLRQALPSPPPSRSHKQTFALLGFACDAGVRRNQGREGARQGPTALRQALAGLPFPWQNIACYDVGDVFCADGRLETSQNELAEAISLLHCQNMAPILLGGGHEMAWGHYCGIVKSFPDQQIGIVNLDAHFDLRDPITPGQGTSGSSFMQIAEHCRQQNVPFDYICLGIQPSANTAALFQRAKDLNVSFMTAQEIYSTGIATALKMLDKIIERHDKIYASLCLDCLASEFAPAVSAPQPLGLTPDQVVQLLQHLSASKKVIGLNIAELAPAYDQDGLTARLAASLIYHYVSGTSSP